MSTFTRRVANTNDDGYKRFGTWRTTALYLGDDSYFGDDIGAVRFNNVTVPKNATINSAKITFKATGTSSYQYYLKIKGIAEDDTADFSTDPTGRSVTSAVIDWDPNGFTDETDIDTSNIGSIVQELVNRAGWASGNDMGFLIFDDGGSGHEVNLYDYADSSSYCALLTIEYTAGSPSSSVSPSVSPSASVSPSSSESPSKSASVSPSSSISRSASASLSPSASISPSHSLSPSSSPSPSPATNCIEDQGQHITDNYLLFGSGNRMYIGESFTPSVTGKLCNIRLWLDKRNGYPSKNIKVRVFEADANGLPKGWDPSYSDFRNLTYQVGISQEIDGSLLPNYPDYAMVDFPIDSDILNSGTSYVFCIDQGGIYDNLNNFSAASSNSDLYAGGHSCGYDLTGGNYWRGTAGTTPTLDLQFAIYMDQTATISNSPSASTSPSSSISRSGSPSISPSSSVSASISPSVSPSASYSPSASISPSVSPSSSISPSSSPSPSPMPPENPSVLKIAKPGVNVLTNSDVENFIFNSEYGTLKYFHKEAINLTINALADDIGCTGEYVHNLNKYLYCEVYVSVYIGDPTGIYEYCPFAGAGATILYDATYKIEKNKITVYGQLEGMGSEVWHFDFLVFVFNNDLNL